MLEFGRDLEEFIKENFDTNNLFDQDFLNEIKKYAIKNKRTAHIDLIKSKMILFDKVFTKAIYINEDIFLYRLNIYIGFLSDLINFSMHYDKDLFRLYFFSNVLHEIMHAKHSFMFSREGIENTTNTIIKHSLSVSDGDISLSGKKVTKKKEIQSEKFYIKYYNFLPEERHAELSALYFLFDLYREIKPQNLDVLFDYHSYIINGSAKEYTFKDKLSSPLRQFYRLINRIDLYNKLDFSGYSLRDKYIFGMPLTREEINEVCYPFLNFDEFGNVHSIDKKLVKKEWENRYVK